MSKHALPKGYDPDDQWRLGDVRVSARGASHYLAVRLDGDRWSKRNLDLLCLETGVLTQGLTAYMLPAKDWRKL